MPAIALTLDRRQTVILSAGVGALGASALVAQLSLMRELLGAFSGNELVFGIVLGVWMLLTGLGSYLGKTAGRLTAPIAVLIVAQSLVAVLPIVDVFLLRTLRDVVFIRGAEVGPTETVAACAALLAPYCLLVGYLLPLATRVLSSEDQAGGIGWVYFLDNLGGIAGGLLFGFVLVHWLDHFRILGVLGAANLVLASATAWVFRRPGLLALTIANGTALAVIVLACDLDLASSQLQFPGQTIEFRGQSPYGNLIVTESTGQQNFIENGVYLFGTHNVEEVEQAVHFAMIQRPEARRVLLLSGGARGTAREILKYRQAAVDYVEIDPLILDVARTFLPGNLDDPRIRIVNTDPRLFVRKATPGPGPTADSYDVAIVDTPDPSTSQINRFYTEEFFRQLRQRLAPDGVASVAIGRYEDHVSDELARLIAVTHRTLSQVFRNVLMIPAGRITFLASDGPLTTRIAQRLDEYKIQTRLLHPRYLADVLSPLRTADLQRALSADAPINRDFSPILYYYHLLYWMSQFKVSFGLLEAALGLTFVLCLFRLRAVSLAMFTTGLAASALEVVLLLALQVLYGCIYQQISLIMTMFMAGLGIGSWLMNRVLHWGTPRSLACLGLGLAGYAAVLPTIVFGLSRLTPAAPAAVTPLAVLVLVLVLAALVGLIFPLAARIDFRNVTRTAARLYTADYLGAAVGALLVSTWLMPVVGMAAVCYLTAGLSMATSGVLLWSSRRS